MPSAGLSCSGSKCALLDSHRALDMDLRGIHMCWSTTTCGSPCLNALTGIRRAVRSRRGAGYARGTGRDTDCVLMPLKHSMLEKQAGYGGDLQLQHTCFGASVLQLQSLDPVERNKQVRLFYE
jgi:hypothetical protein